MEVAPNRRPDRAERDSHRPEHTELILHASRPPEGCVSTAHLIGRAAGLACMRDKLGLKSWGEICRYRPCDDRLPDDFSPAFFWAVI